MKNKNKIIQNYINSDSKEENNINLMHNPLDIKKENFEKMKIIKYFMKNNILQDNIK